MWSASTTRAARRGGVLWQQIGDGHCDIGPCERRHDGAWAESLDVEVAPAELRRLIQPRLAVDLKYLVHQIHDPVIGDAGTRVEAPLVAAVEEQARLGDLDQESGPGGVLGKIVAREAGNNRDVRLRLGLGIERNRVLHPDEPPWATGHA